MQEQKTTDTSKVSLKVLRSSLPLTQRQLATLAGLNERTITAIESGGRAIRLTTAFSVVNAINRILEGKQRPIITVHSLNWILQDSEELEAM
jgi:DNA-binding XRE family transcriptional regulator